MIGAKGLLGKSWPDLDMLPLGWLTHPGSNEGPHRSCNLNPDEHRTQVTLWSMAKSPFMFGGDVRKLDESTYNAITNPTLLEITWFSSNNMEFPYVTGMRVHRTDEVHSYQSRRYAIDVRTSDTQGLALTACSNSEAIGWSTEALDEEFEKICWKESLKEKIKHRFAYTRESLFWHQMK
ncbi:hypothetical protein I3760_11G025100 [Carya illinoinensis]|nr:hypothetical protein I3760_11G025100 [Carya illinoinensis]